MHRAIVACFTWSLLAIGIATPLRALADDAVAPFATYLREGPGVLYRVIDEIAGGQHVDSDACNDGWCRVVSGSASGYVLQASLTASRDARVSTPQNCFLNRIAGYKGGAEQRFCAER